MNSINRSREHGLPCDSYKRTPSKLRLRSLFQAKQIPTREQRLRTSDPFGPSRREPFRNLTFLFFRASGVLKSEVLTPIEPKLNALKKSLPPGYQLQIGGERAKQVDGFTNLAVVLLISLVGIYLALLIQFNNAVKPLLVFAAAPYGAIGALIALAIMGDR